MKINKFCLIVLATIISTSSLAQAKAFQVNTLSGGSLTTNLSAYYKLTIDAMDFYSTKNLTNGTLVTFDPNGASFDGSSQYLDDNGSDYHDIQRLSPASMAVWAKRTVSGVARVIASKYDAPGDHGWFLGWWSSNKIIFILRSASGTDGIQVSTNNTFTETASYHLIVVTYNGSGSASGVHIYVDNVDQALTVDFNNLTTETDMSSSTNFIIGKLSGLGSLYFIGYMKEYARWEKVLSSTELGDLWNNGAGQTMCTVGVDCPTHNAIFFGVDY